MKKTRPFLKWAGNKYRCIDNILQSLPSGSRLIEPFSGSAAVFLNASYPAYLLCEANKDLINLFHHTQKGGADFIDTCARLFCPENNNEIAYYQLREEFNRLTYSKKRAAIFLYLNRHGYNGLCRYNQQGIYNVPFGRYIKPYFPRNEMFAFYIKSQHATLMHADFREAFTKAVPGDVIYCDPPYVPLNQQTNFSSYTDKKFGEEEQIALAELATRTASQGIIVIISNHDTEFTRHHYHKGIIHSFPVRRSISCQSDSRLIVSELVAIFK